MAAAKQGFWVVVEEVLLQRRWELWEVAVEVAQGS